MATRIPRSLISTERVSVSFVERARWETARARPRWRPSAKGTMHWRSLHGEFNVGVHVHLSKTKHGNSRSWCEADPLGGVVDKYPYSSTLQTNSPNNRSQPKGNGPLVKLEGFSNIEVWLVEGIASSRRLPRARFQTMIVLRAKQVYSPRDKRELILINPFRVDEETERQVARLGKISAVLRLVAGSADGDDRYYMETYGAKSFVYQSATSASSNKLHMPSSYWNSEHCQVFTQDSPPDCFEKFPRVEVLDIPVHPDFAESILFFPDEQCLFVAAIMQNNDPDHTRVYGMTLSDLKLSRVSIALSHLSGDIGHLHTPKAYLKSRCSDPAQLQLLMRFHGKLMCMDWDRVVCHRGGPSMQSARRIRRDAIKDWPAEAFGVHSLLAVV